MYFLLFHKYQRKKKVASTGIAHRGSNSPDKASVLELLTELCMYPKADALPWEKDYSSLTLAKRLTRSFHTQRCLNGSAPSPRAGQNRVEGHSCRDRVEQDCPHHKIRSPIVQSMPLGGISPTLLLFPLQAALLACYGPSTHCFTMTAEHLPLVKVTLRQHVSSTCTMQRAASPPGLAPEVRESCSGTQQPSSAH